MITVIKPFSREFPRETRMDHVLSAALKEYDVKYCLTAEELAHTDMKDRKILFAVCLSLSGLNQEYYKMLDYIRRTPNCFRDSIAGILVDGAGELYTKSLARDLVFSANVAGCTFPGKSLVEATGSMMNFDIMGRVLGMDRLGAYENRVKDLVKKIDGFLDPHVKTPNILVVHASSRKTSNSLLLWEKVREKIGECCQINEISLRNGRLWDCRGCKYEDCLHFGEQGECFYGGIMVKQVYPAIIQCDVLVLVCPNYNDAVGANITAFINRLTAVFRTNDFSKKKLFALIVSGYSGGDIVAEQIISAMNFNKNFILPGNFAIVETANDPGSILHVEDLEQKCAGMATRIIGEKKRTDSV